MTQRRRTAGNLHRACQRGECDGSGATDPYVDEYSASGPLLDGSGLFAAIQWGIQAVKLVLNGGNGFARLTNSAQLFVEYSNETWNAGGCAFSQTYYCAYRGFLRWPASGTADYASMASLRSVINVEDIKKSTTTAAALSL